ncbi:MAG: outer membrane lipoprotein-sorting protein [Candidatus Binatia bacterium]
MLVLAVAVLTLAPLRAGAETAREILDRAHALDNSTRHWTDRSQHLTLLIVGAGGDERRRELTVMTKRYPGDETKALSSFLEPSEVKGTAFLQWGHKNAPDEQWLYLPDLRRTRRITSDLSSESFMGTDFSYQDLGILSEAPSWTEEEAPSTLVGEETVDGHACYVIALRPKQEDMAYSRIQVWLDKEALVPRRMDFFDKDDAAVKSLLFEGIENIGAFPSARVLEMRQLKTGSKTRLEASDVKFDTGLSDDLFTQRYLERGAPQ